MNNLYVLFFFASAAVSALSQVLLKKAALNPSSTSQLGNLLNWRVILAYGMLLGTTMLNMVGYRHHPLSVGSLINSSSYIFVGILSVVIFKEKMNHKNIISYVLILAGITIIMV